MRGFAVILLVVKLAVGLMRAFPPDPICGYYFCDRRAKQIELERIGAALKAAIDEEVSNTPSNP